MVRNTRGEIAAAVLHGIEGEYYRPTILLLHSLNHLLFGDAPVTFRLTNLLIHILNAFLVNYLVSRITLSYRASFGVAALFAIHPLAVTPIAWVSDRTDLIALFSALVFMSLLWAHAERPRARLVCAMTATCLIGLGAKETSAMVLPITAAIAGRAPPLVRRRILWAMGPVLAVAVAWFYWRHRISLVSVAHESGLSVSQRLSLASYIHLEYLRQLIVPSFLSVCDGTEVPVHAFPWILAGMALFVTAGASGIRAIGRDDRPVMYSLLWVAAFLAPTSGIVALKHIRADRYLYCAMPGLLLLFVLAVERCATLLKRPRLASTVSFGLCYTYFAFGTVSRAHRFTDDLTLWTAETEQNESCLEGYSVLARAHLIRGHFDAALANSDRALYPPAVARVAFLDLDGALQHRGLILIARGNVEHGERLLIEVLADSQGRRKAEAAYHLALVAFDRGDHSRVIQYLDKAADAGMAPKGYGDLYLLRSYSNLRVGHTAKAALDFERFREFGRVASTPGRRALVREISIGLSKASVQF